MTILIAIILMIAFAFLAILILRKERDGDSDALERPFKYYKASTFYETHKFGIVQSPIGDDIMDRIGDAMMEDSDKVKVYDDEIDELAKAAEEYKAKEQKLYDAARLNNDGMAAEKSGDIKKAISLYERNILPGTYFTLHPYHRLCVLYRRQKDFDNEIRVIEAALSRFDPKSESKERQLFAERLEKARKYNKQLNQKSEL